MTPEQLIEIQKKLAGQFMQKLMFIIMKNTEGF